MHRPNRRAERTREQILIADEMPPKDVATRDLSFAGPVERSPARLYIPPESQTPIARGGLCARRRVRHRKHRIPRRPVPPHRCEARARVISLDYRLAPEHPFPAAIEDSLAGLRFVIERGVGARRRPRRVAIAGDSAGGTISAVLSRRTRDDDHRPALAVLLYPDTDATCSFSSHQTMGHDYFLTRENIDWYLDRYAAGADRKQPDLSPLFAEDLGRLPRTLIYSAGFDPLRDEALAYANKLRAAGVSVEYEELLRHAARLRAHGRGVAASPVGHPAHLVRDW